jgi:putative transcriptional regulator
MSHRQATSPPVSGVLKELHHRIEAKERGRISQAAMAQRLGISTRTYLEYLRGTNAPIGMRVVLDLLCMLDEQELSQVLRHWKLAQTTISPSNSEACA